MATGTYEEQYDSLQALCELPPEGEGLPAATAALTEPTAAAPSGTEGLPVIRRGKIHDRKAFQRFACDVRTDNPDTPDRVRPDVRMTRQVHSGADVVMPDGRRVRFWGFRDPDSRDKNDRSKPFPSPLIRARVGDVVHCQLKASKNTHTIHFHGIEPTAHNDGVGHTSFEVSGSYTYQWRPHAPGLYFYHCHKNTVLHFELGMYGAIVIDPPEGEGFVLDGRGPVRYEHERIWFFDDVDPTWHGLNHSAGLRCSRWDTDHAMHVFEPRYFLINGVPDPRCRTHRKVALDARVGDTAVLRVGNAAYTLLTLTFPFDVKVIGVDGHALGADEAGHQYSEPFWMPAAEPLRLTSAQRRDLLVRFANPGVFPVRATFRDWITYEALGYAETLVTVRP
jgi:plastocyanin